MQETSANIRRQAQLGISNPVLGMAFLLVTELMFFGGLISAFIVNKAGWDWPPIGQPRLPVEVTAVTTIVLLISAVTILLATKSLYQSENGIPSKANRLLAWTITLGLVFLIVQGFEWIRLLNFGLTTTSSLYGAFFYTIIGAHGLHVLAGLTLLLYLWYYLKKPEPLTTKKDIINACSLYWYFVVGIWPILYILVYLT